MPKMKTDTSAKKRIKVTGTGRLFRRKSGKTQALTKKDTSRRLRGKQMAEVVGADRNRMKRLMGR